MLQTAIGFSLGVLVFQHLPFLPSPWYLLLFLPVISCWWKYPAYRLAYLVMLGFLWSLTYAWMTKPVALPAKMLGQDLQVSGYIIQIPKPRPGSSSFLFRADTLSHAGNQFHDSWLFRLSWYENPPVLTSGDRWQLTVRLKQAHGFMNPGSFDYEGWLYAQGVKYTGYVRGENNLRLGDRHSLHRLRQLVSARIASTHTDQRAAAVARGLAVGDRHGLSTSDKDLFAATGTSHLMAISGLHIGLVSGLIYALVRMLWCWIPALCRRWPASVAAAPAAMLAALMYSALAGFSVPTQRALIMLSLVMLALLLRQKVKPLQTLSLAVLAVLIWNPSALVSAGFWLSFAAVSVILLSSSGPANYRWLKIQFMVALGLLPVLLAYQMNVALLSPLINLLAIPVFGMLIVPMVLLATLLLFVWPTAAVWLFQLTTKVILLAMDGLQFAADWSPVWQGSGKGTAIALLLWIVGLGLLLAPRGMPARWLGLPLLLPLLFPGRQSLAQGEFEFTLLDVGQGLSAVVQTANHTLVFDTGPRFRSGFDTGSQVVAPFLRQAGVQKVDVLLLSHSDIDHAGGAQGLMENIPVENILAGEPSQQKIRVQVSACEAGQRWRWDGVDFSLLYPAKNAQILGNNASCVLKISNRAGSVLLTGDVEREAERLLVQRSGKDLPVDVVVAPHHGSASSSGLPFIKATDADLVLYSAGFLNRWGFPNEQVAKRWSDAGVNAMNTAHAGAISIHFGAQGISQPSPYREKARAWYHH